MSIKQEFTEKMVMPVVAAGGFAVTPIIKEPEQNGDAPAF